jgi:hypothetical protein
VSRAATLQLKLFLTRARWPPQQEFGVLRARYINPSCSMGPRHLWKGCVLTPCHSLLRYHLQRSTAPWPSNSVRDAIRKYAPMAAHVQIAGVQTWAGKEGQRSAHTSSIEA